MLNIPLKKTVNITKMTVYKDKYREVKFDTISKTLYQTWYKETEYMTDAEYKETSTSLFELLKTHGAEKILIDAKDLLYMVSVETQDWLNKNILPKYLQAGIQKIAIILPKAMFQQVSVQQTVKDNTGTVAEQKIRMFGDKINAEDWILN